MAKRSPNFYCNENIIVGPLDITNGTKRNNLGPKKVKKRRKKVPAYTSGGFEPQPCKKFASLTGALDHSATATCYRKLHILAIKTAMIGKNVIFFVKVFPQTFCELGIV